MFPVNTGLCQDIVRSLIAFAHPLHPSVTFAHFETVPFCNFRSRGAYKIESSLDFASINIFGTVMITVQRFLRGIHLRTAKRSWVRSAKSRSSACLVSTENETTVISGRICKTQQNITSIITASAVQGRVDMRNHRVRTEQAQGTDYRRQSTGILPLSTGIRDPVKPP